MRTIFMLLAALLIAVAAGSWSRSERDPEPSSDGSPAPSSQAAARRTSRDERRVETPAHGPRPSEAAPANSAARDSPEAREARRDPGDAPVIELAQRPPFLPESEDQEDPAPGAVDIGGRDAVDRTRAGSDGRLVGTSGIERSGDWVRRLLALYETLRE